MSGTFCERVHVAIRAGLSGVVDHSDYQYMSTFNYIFEKVALLYGSEWSSEQVRRIGTAATLVVQSIPDLLTWMNGDMDRVPTTSMSIGEQVMSQMKNKEDWRMIIVLLRELVPEADRMLQMISMELNIAMQFDRNGVITWNRVDEEKGEVELESIRSFVRENKKYLNDICRRFHSLCMKSDGWATDEQAYRTAIKESPLKTKKRKLSGKEFAESLGFGDQRDKWKNNGEEEAEDRPKVVPRRKKKGKSKKKNKRRKDKLDSFYFWSEAYRRAEGSQRRITGSLSSNPDQQ